MANSHSLDLESGSSQYAYITDQAELSLTGDFTIEAWVKPESLTTNGTIAAKWYPGASKKSFRFEYDTDGKLFLVISVNGSAGTTGTSTDAISTGSWQHVAVSYDASEGTCQFYIDGSDAGSDSGLANSIHDNDSRFSVGAIDTDDTPSEFFDGLIDEVRVWNDIRSQAEIQANDNKEISGSSDNLVGYWRLNNDYTDETSNENTLTASGSPVFSTDIPTFVEDTVTGAAFLLNFV